MASSDPPVLVTFCFSVDAFIPEVPELEDSAGTVVMLTVDEMFKVVGRAVFPKLATSCKCRIFGIKGTCTHVAQHASWRKLEAPHVHVAVLKVQGTEVISATTYVGWKRNSSSITTSVGAYLAQPGMFLSGQLPEADIKPGELSLNLLRTRELFAHISAADESGKSLMEVGEPSASHGYDNLKKILQGPTERRTPTTPDTKPSSAVPTPMAKVSAEVKPPVSTEFAVEHKTWRQCLYALSTQQNLLLVGPSGCGKTELVKHLGIQAKRMVASFNFGGMTEPRASLIGNIHLDPAKGTWFSESRFVRAITTPNTLVLLDELSRAPRDAFNLLLTLLDGQRYLALDECSDGKVVNVAKDVVFVATANMGMEYTGTSALDRALKDRFTTLELDFPAYSTEKELLQSRTKLKPMEADWLVKIANNQRTAARDKQEFFEVVSTRMLLNAANQIVFGVPLLEAITYCLLNIFSGEGGSESDREKLMHIVRSVIPAQHLK